MTTLSISYNNQAQAQQTANARPPISDSARNKAEKLFTKAARQEELAREHQKKAVALRSEAIKTLCSSSSTPTTVSNNTSQSQPSSMANTGNTSVSFSGGGMPNIKISV